jgi:hypothetical protein
MVPKGHALSAYENAVPNSSGIILTSVSIGIQIGEKIPYQPMVYYE